MIIADNDLLAMQHARILAENAREAQRTLAAFPQGRLDEIALAMARALLAEAPALAGLEFLETGYGCEVDKLRILRFVGLSLPRAFARMRCVGPLETDPAGRILKVGVPRGVLAVLCPVTAACAVTASAALMAVKSGNAAVFPLHPGARKAQGRTVELLAGAAEAAGLPEGAIAALPVPAKRGVEELLTHPAVSLVLYAGVEGLRPMAESCGKPLISASPGNGPAFIERTADLARAARDIVLSKSFDCGLAPACEQCVVVDAPVAEAAKQAFVREGAHFLSEAETRALAGFLFSAEGRRRSGVLGLPAEALARGARFAVPPGTRVLVCERGYVGDRDLFNRDLLNPVLPWYVEEDWISACAKCIELLLFGKEGHSLAIHSEDPEVVRQFALRKPVARLLVNTPACLGAMGVTTDLFPSLLLGGGQAGHGLISGNITPSDLVHVRRMGYGRELGPALSALDAEDAASPRTASAPSGGPRPGEDPDLEKVRLALAKFAEALGSAD